VKFLPGIDFTVKFTKLHWHATATATLQEFILNETPSAHPEPQYSTLLYSKNAKKTLHVLMEGKLVPA
jgi:hypothetical protein